MLKVKLASSDHSGGRGIGLYADNLANELHKLPNVAIVNDDPDLIHYLFFDPFYCTLPLVKTLPTIITIHDLTPLVLSKLYPKGIRGRLGLFHQRISLHNVQAIITDSKNSKADIVKFFKISPSKIFPIYLAFDQIFSKPISPKNMAAIKTKYHLPDKFVLTVAGGPNPNKNLPALAKATKQLKLQLVIVGRDVAKNLPSGPIHAELTDLARLKDYDHILYPGFVPTDDLASFYRLATIYCQPSLYEGFGIPILEAMASGCLLVSSNSSSLPELYYPEAINFDPTNTMSMINAIRSAIGLSENAKGKHIQSGYQQAKRFSWKETATRTADVYYHVNSNSQ